MQQLDLFGGQRLARRPYCTDDPTTGLRIRPLETALQHSHIQPNHPTWLWRLIFDVDRPAGAWSWDEAGLPPPNWTATNPRNGHAHVGYEILVPIVRSDAARREPIRLAAAVEIAYTRAMGADIDYSGLVCKNPIHPKWLVERLCAAAYDLGTLAEYVDLPQRLTKRELATSPVGRNCSIFDSLRQWAYKSVRGYEHLAEWEWACKSRAHALNAFAAPLDPREVEQIAKSVAKWVWRRFDVAASDARFSALQAHRGRMGGRPATTTQSGNPWDAEGVSRATWYRRQAVRQKP
jgi:hypothetical protein